MQQIDTRCGSGTNSPTFSVYISTYYIILSTVKDGYVQPMYTRGGLGTGSENFFMVALHSTCTRALNSQNLWKCGLTAVELVRVKHRTTRRGGFRVVENVFCFFVLY